VPYRDFYANYPPGAFVLLAAAWSLVGTSVTTLHAVAAALQVVVALLAGRLSGLASGGHFRPLAAGLTLVFLAPPGQPDAQVELTHNWDPEVYTGGRNFGHLAYAVDDIYAACRRLQEHGVTINRPPRDGRMAFVRSPDNISIELLQAGHALAPAEPWASMPNVGQW